MACSSLQVMRVRLRPRSADCWPTESEDAIGGRARATIAQSYSRDAASEKLLLIYRRFGVNNREASQSHAGR